MMPGSELDDLMDRIGRKYDVEAVPLRIGDRTLKILQLKDFEAYLEELIEGKGAGIGDLPYWAKVWDASILLAYFLGRQPVAVGRQILEIGAGIGVVGIYAALCGHRVTISDIDDDALLFARANVLLNDLTGVEVKKIDWNTPELGRSYDVIAGSEVVYQRETYPALVNFLRRALAPEGMIFLAKNAGLNTPKFFEELTRYFELKQTIQNIRSEGEDQRIALYAIRRKGAGR